MTLKGKRVKKSASTTPPMGEVIKAALEKARAQLVPLIEKVKPHWQALPKPHRIGVSVLAALLVVLLIWPSSDESKEVVVAEGERVSLPLDLSGNTQSAQQVDDEDFDNKAEPVVSTQTVDTDWVNYEVQRGDTLSNIFRNQSLPLPDLYAISAIEGADKPLSRIQPGQLLRFKRNTQGELDMLQIEASKDKSVIFFRLSDGSFARRN
ncbi:cell envelope opacity-associated protein A [Enterovibrio sp. ZSDZ35]|uniref:Cell envelope opacity-associated protein A n=1 Tax=Enterovibrio qingdaonensis TaxID=2899818 RepID=A0ABT5QL37_9GAMM|nr:LysM-like peptidoglycan-binding domain-containing protein [Enterovibrio sp. ZSDZ35]MDD1781594.1 cell envelope opacity-associated protein A [Enterovibrio sp. ZSDZ35]